MAPRVINVLALAVGGNVTQGILKALKRSQVPNRVVGADISALKIGLYTSERAYLSPWAGEARFVPWLIETCKKENIDIVLTGCEPILRVLSPLRATVEAATGAYCLVNAPEVMAIGEDKLETCRWLEAQGFNFPCYAAADNVEALAALIDACGFPLAAKPRIGGGAHGFLMLGNEHELAAVRGRGDYIVQELLGDTDNEYTVGVFCDRRGEKRATIAMRRTLHGGTTHQAVLGAYPEVRAEAERIAGALKPLGPFNVQLRVTSRGPVCFELNPRFSGTAPLRAYYGFNEAEAVLRHFVLDEETLALPVVTRGTALRYWNEAYVDQEAVQQLERDGCLNDPHAYPLHVEDYGIRG